jgi:DNA repair protein RecN (Recombination protein N)
MLEEIAIQDFALIDRVQVRFSEGLNLLTGETGAGKSIIVGALGAVLGERLDASVVRTGCEEASVSAVVFAREGSEARAWLAFHDIPCEDGNVVLRRVIRSNGRTSVYIQNVPVARTDLQELTGMLFDLHGQHEHQSLLKPENHRRLLDDFSGLGDQVRSFTASFLALGEKKKRLEEMTGSARDRTQRMELLEYAVDEITQAKLKRDEDVELEAEEKKISQFEKLYSHIEQAAEYSGEGQGALQLLRKAKLALEGAAVVDPSLLPLTTRFNDAYFELDDIASAIRTYKDSVSFDPARLETIESRLAEIYRLKKKYGPTLADVIAYREKSSADLDSLRNWEEDRGGLEKTIAEGERALYLEAEAISAKRKEAAGRLGTLIRDSVRKLGMPKASFEVMVSRRENGNGRQTCTAYGIDDIEFLISPNPGEPAKPLALIASGGELSRVMLAVKTILAEADTVETLVFDEIDTGIGGEVALEVGKFLHDLSSRKQILCITHLASIAVRADNHLRVEKDVSGERTVTSVSVIEGVDREGEISRMLSGESDDLAARAHARELLKKYGYGRGRIDG